MVRLSIHERLALDAYLTIIAYQDEFREFEVYLTKYQRHSFYKILEGCTIVQNVEEGVPIIVTLKNKEDDN